MRITAFILLSLILLGCGSQTSGLKIATSANMQFAMTEIAANFEAKHQIKVDLIIGSSGKLTAQIAQGAPFDVFISADHTHPNFLHNLGLTEQAPKTYGFGKLVLWTCKNHKPSLDLLFSPDIRKIAIPNPDIAPYGKAALEVLNNYFLFEKIQHKLVFGESISQCNHFISTEAVDVGFTSLSTVLAPKMKSTGTWTPVDSKLHDHILQGAVILKNSSQKNKAELFYNYLYSEDSQHTLNKYGYLNESH